MRRGREEARVRGESRGREGASRAMGSAVHVKQQGTENNDMRNFIFRADN